MPSMDAEKNVPDSTDSTDGQEVERPRDASPGPAVGDEAKKVAVAKPTPPAVPNGGFQAWLQVVGAFFVYFNTWGLVSAYGSFQAYYETALLKDHTPFQVSTIGSLQSFLLVFLGFLAGPVYDAGYFRQLLSIGSLLILVGTVTQSFCTEFWQLLLAQGLCIGIGCGCLGILSVAIPSLWFSTRLPLANGVAAAGSGLGGAIFPIMIRNLLPQVNFGWTVRAIALVVLVTMGAANLVLRAGPQQASSTPTTKRQRRRLIDRPSLTDWPYVLFTFGCFAVFLGLYTPFFYVPTYAVSSGIIPNEGTAFYLLTALNLASIPGRVVPGLLARRLGSMDMIVGTCVAIAATGLGFLGAKSEASLFVVASIYGFLVGAFFALQPTNFVRLTDDMRVMGTRFGMAFTVMSVALLFGSPISGALQGRAGYDASWAWTGVTVFVGGVIIVLARGLKAGWDPRVRY